MKIITWCLTSLLFCSASVVANDFQPLFDGKNLGGWQWQKYGGDATYKIEKGAIVGINGARHNTFLTTTKTYANFDLTFDVYLTDKLNSGIQIRSQMKEEHKADTLIQTRLYGPQVEIEQSPGKAGYIYGERLFRGWLTQEAKDKSHQYFNNNDWNQYRILADGPRIKTWVNGHLVSNYYNEEIYAAHHEGVIALQVHSTNQPAGTLQVKWRNIQIKELPVTKNHWQNIFNGYSFAGWLPKVTGYELGENPGNIFSINNGAMHFDHKAFIGLEGRFAHIFYKEAFSHYRLKFKYRFLEHLVDSTPNYVYRNSGVMLHSQHPMTIGKYQSFPTSVEAQLLGSSDKRQRTTANVCTPGTDIFQNNKKVARHCINSTSKPYFGDQWVEMEIKVLGNEEIVHYINGKEVLRYQSPQTDDGKLLSSGWLSFQAEGHELEIKDIQIMKL